MPVRVIPVLAFAVCMFAGIARGQAVVATLSGVGAPEDIAVDATRNMVYTASGNSNFVGFVDGSTHAATTVGAGRRPQFIAVNTVTNRIYVSNSQDNTLSVIDGATRAVVSLAINGAGPIVVNERTNKVYVMRSGHNGEVTVVDGATHDFYAISTGSHTPQSMVINPNTNRLYVSHFASGDVRAIDLSSPSDHPPAVSIEIRGHPTHLALNAQTNKIYVQSDDAGFPVVAIDGATNARQSIATPGASGAVRSIAVNPATNRIYAAVGSQIVVIDGATNTVIAYVAAGDEPNHFVVDPTQNRVFGLLGNAAAFVLQGSNNSLTRVALPSAAVAIAVNTNTHRAYAGNAVIDPGPSAPPPAPPVASHNYQGLWWNSGESGWGANIAQQGEKLFATWFTYDESGAPSWFVMPDGNRSMGEEFRGALYRVSGPGYAFGAFDASKVSSQVVGMLVFRFSDRDNGVMEATVNGVQVNKAITRQVFAAPVPACAAGGTPAAQPNYTDLWWKSPAGSESGWGIFLTHQGDNVFLTWYTYDTNGKPLWLVASNVVKTGNATYSGTLYRTAGPPFASTPWSSARVSNMPVGSVALTFPDASNGVFTYNVGGVAGSKTITRQSFATPATICR